MKKWFLTQADSHKNVYDWGMVSIQFASSCEKTKNLENNMAILIIIYWCIGNPIKHKVCVENIFNLLQLLKEMSLREFQITESAKENRLQKVTLNGSKVLGEKQSSHKLLQQSVFFWLSVKCLLRE